ncbi:MAG: GNAT family N-acetyltransferase [Firmicutes bacterium]|jgi:RimJ/RimL family protein N-acetyltransferase|nr:GNAT family N-acetyltransferase [Bacillota bacterium]
MLMSGDKVRLRLATPDDFPHIVSWGRDEKVAQDLEGDYPTTLEECAAWLQTIKSDRHALHYVIVSLHDDRPIGDIQLDHITWRSGDGELRIRIGERHLWDQGFGTDAVITLLRYAFLNMRLSCIYLRVFASNLRAIRCYEKAGFRKEGRLMRRTAEGQERETFLMSVRRADFLRTHSAKEGTQTA